jgi:RNA polymerase-binding transcription factor DksA
MIALKHDAIRTQLEDRLTRLLRRANKIERDLRQTRNPDWQERATEQENDEVLEGLDDVTLGEIGQIRAALRRIDSGHYGICSVCGGSIGAERLLAVPSAITCTACMH